MRDHGTVDSHSGHSGAIDLILYAPLGLALAARELLPTLATKGRNEWQSRTETARLVGNLVTKQGSQELRRRMNQWGLVVPNGEQTAPQATAPQATAARPTGASPASSTRADSPKPSELLASTRPSAGDRLAIAGYDTLSATQIVSRLAGLSTDELEAVGIYEKSGRARRTILNRVRELETP